MKFMPMPTYLTGRKAVDQIKATLDLETDLDLAISTGTSLKSIEEMIEKTPSLLSCSSELSCIRRNPSQI